MRFQHVKLVVTALVGPILLGYAPSATAQVAPIRSIEHIAGDVYYFHENTPAGHNGILAVTSEGVILVDPIRAEAADWLKGHISQRFGQTVKTIIYSHHHGDHAAGAEAYVDTVEEIIAHENVPAGIIEDDLISVMPTRTFSSHLTVELGNKTVELTEVGPGHSDDLVAVGFPEERVLFIVDAFSGRRLPVSGRVGDRIGDVETVVGTLRHIENIAMDYDILATGHTGATPTVTIADLVAYRTFLENLRAQVLQYRKEGKTVDEMKGLITMEAYRDWLNYEAWLPLSIEAMNTYLENSGLSS